MLYTFSSRSAAKVCMLPSHARALLHIVGKRDAADAPDAAGILTCDQIEAALQALSQAIRAEEDAAAQARQSTPASQDEAHAPLPDVSLRQRAQPLMAMLQRSAQAGHDVVWTV